VQPPVTRKTGRVALLCLLAVLPSDAARASLGGNRKWGPQDATNGMPRTSTTENRGRKNGCPAAFTSRGNLRKFDSIWCRRMSE